MNSVNIGSGNIEVIYTKFSLKRDMLLISQSNNANSFWYDLHNVWSIPDYSNYKIDTSIEWFLW